MALMPPSLDWSEDELMQFLADAWGMMDPNHIRVLGRLRIADAGGFGFIEDLHDATTGVRLPSLKNITALPQSVFVPPPEIRSLDERWAGAHYVVSELMLAPLTRRKQRDDPLACMVAPNSTMPLSQVPDSWGVKVIDDSGRLVMLTAAREAIMSQLQQETFEARSRLEQVSQEYTAELERQIAEREDNQAKKDQLLLALQQAADELEELHEKNITLQAQYKSRKKELENKLRDIASLMRQRGERMVALDLIERDALDALVEPPSKEDSRQGHGYQQVFAGNFSQLAPFIQARLWKQGMLFSQTQLRNFLALMRTHDLVMLAGDSGSGKTSLIKAVAESIGGQYTIIPVKPNWTGPEDLLGYYNPLERSYQATAFLQALQSAEREPEIPYFICLDEMNLARVEHYFADFLSLLESREKSPVISLYTSTEEQHVIVENRLFLELEEEVRQRSDAPSNSTFIDLLKNETANALLHQLGGFHNAESVLLHHNRLRRSMSSILKTPPIIRFPPNVRIIGAINIDETTHYLSPKVLDRAHILRFRNPVLVDWDEIQKELEHFDLDLRLPVLLTADDLGPRESYPPYDRGEKYAALLTELARSYLDPLGIEFGLRSIRQSLGYLQAARLAGIEELVAFDRVIQHKILPKIMFDAERIGSNGQSKRDTLAALRDTLENSLSGLVPPEGDETSVTALQRLIQSIDNNNGIVNYWQR